MHKLWSACILLSLFISPVVRGQDWPQWRGPGRDGIITGDVSSETWTDEPTLLWRVDIGEGHSSPVTVGERIYVHSRQGDNEAVTCLDLTNGKVIWEQVHSVPYTMNSAAIRHGKGPKSTPVVQDGRVFTLGITGVLSCYASENGKLFWRHDFSGNFEATSPLFGTAMSPIVVDDKVVAHVGGHDGGALSAFDVNSGETVWSWNEDGPGYSSPILVRLEGTLQLVTQSQEQIIAIALTDGRQLWQIPFETAHVQNIVTPVIYDDLLIFSGYQKGTFALRTKKLGGQWVSEQVWENPRVSMYMSSPVMDGHLMFGFSQFKRGQLFCLDARTGEVLWTGEGRQGDNAALLLSEERLFVLTDDAEFLVIEKSSQAVKKVAEYTVADSPTWAHPVLVGSRLIVKDESSVALWSF